MFVRACSSRITATSFYILYIFVIRRINIVVLLWVPTETRRCMQQECEVSFTLFICLNLIATRTESECVLIDELTCGSSSFSYFPAVSQC